MGAAPLLIMLAAVGVDYGWQPDGTTSPRGDNVQYIIQIPPHQLDQIKSIGEITSAIDPSIQGRVSSIIVRVGTEPLPRIAGQATATQDVARTSGNDDDAQIPIPEMRVSADAIAAKSASRATTPGSEAMMKPDPQAGGFTLPDSLSNPVRTNPSVSTDPATTGRDNRWDDIRGRATTVPTPPLASGFPAGTSSTSNIVSSSGAQGPSTEPVDPSARSTTWPGFVGPPVPSNLNSGPTSTSLTNPTVPRSATTPNDPNWSGYGTTPNFGTLPPGMNTGQPTAAAAPMTTGTIGYSQNAPSYSQNAPTTGDLLARQAAELQRNAAAQLEATANAAQAFSRDAAGNLLDRLGRPIDSLGRLIDPESGNLVDAGGNWIDQYGRKIDRFGRPLPGETATTSAPNSGNLGATLQPPLLPSQRNDSPYYGQTAANQPVYGNTAQGGVVNPSSGYGQSGLANDPRLNQWQGGTVQGNVGQGNMGQGNMGQAYSRQPDPVYSRGTGTGLAEDNLRSPSDARLSLNPTGASDPRASDLISEREAAFARQSLSVPGRAKSVAAQPFFNFVLLISLVGNAYLIFETGNLRRKFRNMIANVRATKISAQPAG